MPGTVHDHPIESSLLKNRIDSLIMPVIQTRELRVREIKPLALGHRVTRRQSPRVPGDWLERWWRRQRGVIPGEVALPSWKPGLALSPPGPAGLRACVCPWAVGTLVAVAAAGGSRETVTPRCFVNCFSQLVCSGLGLERHRMEV